MHDTTEPGQSRRNFLVKTGLLVAAASLAGVACLGRARRGIKSLKNPAD